MNITLPRAVIEQALEALEWEFGLNPVGKKTHETITALRAALEQPEQEPVATVTSETGAEISMSWWHEPALPVGTKLYTYPPQRKPLSDKEILTYRYMIDWTAEWSYINFARAIETAHNIKE